MTKHLKNSHLSFRKPSKTGYHPYTKTRRREDFKTKENRPATLMALSSRRSAGPLGGLWEVSYRQSAMRVVSGACIQSLDVKAWVSLPGRQHALHSVSCHCWEEQALCHLHDCPQRPAGSLRLVTKIEDLCAATKTRRSQIKKKPNLT